jgi:hypothetical protein
MSSIHVTPPPPQHHASPPQHASQSGPKAADSDGDSDRSTPVKPSNPPGVGGRVDKTA